MGIILFILFCLLLGFLLIKGWVKFINALFNPIIHSVENKNHIPVEPEQKKVNLYVEAHHRWEKNQQFAIESNRKFIEAQKQLQKEYEEYLDWCKANNVIPNQKGPVKGQRIKMYHID